MAFSICKHNIANPFTFFILLILALLASEISAQQVEARMSDIELQQFLDSADQQVTVYSTVFRNLYADQTKTTDVFDRTGKLEKRRIIVSDLIIYESQSGGKKGDLREFHNVREVDGKPVKNRDKRAINLFNRLKQADSIDKELERIRKESLRYDREVSVYGFALGQTAVLSPQVRSAFKFIESRREKIGERLAIVIGFQQISAHPSFDFKINSPDQLEAKNPFYRGEIWIDKESKAIKRYWKEITIESPRFTEPFVIIRQEAEYQPSEFGIALPVKIVFESYNLKVTKKDVRLMRTQRMKPEVYRSKRLLLEFKAFRKFDVTVESDK